MSKRGAFIGIGSVLLVMGIAGLALVQTGVIVPTSPKTAGSPTEQKLALPPPETASPQSGTTGNKLAEPVKPQEPQQEAPTERPLLPPAVGKGERRYPGQSQAVETPPAKPQPQPRPKTEQPKPSAKPLKNYARQESPAPKQSVSLRVRFDPSRDRNVRLATVHWGDRVVVSVRRVGQPDARLYLSFNMHESFRSSSSGRSRQSGVVLTPIKDEDELVLSAEKQFGPFLSRQLDSKDGAVLRLTAQNDSRRSRNDRGYYEIQMTIYAGNRWDIKPRSFL